MKVWSKSASISVTITDIWTKCGTEHKYHTANTLEWPNSHKLKIQDGGGRHLEFRKNVNNSGLDKDILHQIIWEDAPRRRGNDHVTKSRNRKLIRVTSSNEGLKHMCIDLSDYNRYFNQVWYRTQIPLPTRRSGQIHINWKSKMAAAAILNFGKKVNNFTLDKDILPQMIWKDAQRRRGDDHMTKSRNRKLIRVTSSNEGLKHICVDLSDYNRYLDQIWYRTQIPCYQHARMAKFTKTKNSRWRRPPSWISEKCQ